MKKLFAFAFCIVLDFRLSTALPLANKEILLEIKYLPKALFLWKNDKTLDKNTVLPEKLKGTVKRSMQQQRLLDKNELPDKTQMQVKFKDYGFCANRFGRKNSSAKRKGRKNWFR